MKKDEILSPIRNLQKRLDEIADSLALDIEQFILVPQQEGIPHDTIHVVAVLRQDAVLSAAEREQYEMDLKFKEIEKNEFQREILDAHSNKVEEDIKSWFSSGEVERAQEEWRKLLEEEDDD